MIMKATATGKTVEEALAAAKAQLGINDGDNYETVEVKQPSKKVLGLFGGSPASVTLSVEKEEPKKQTKKNDKKQNKKSDKKPENVSENKQDKKHEKAVENSAQTELSDEKPEEYTLIPTESQDYSIAADTVEYLKKILDKMDVTELTVETYKTKDGFEIAFNGKGLGTAIGRKGDTLDALQHLCSLIANRDHADYIRVTLNPSGYREKRKATLQELAVRTANKAKEKERNYTLEPMNAYERRIVHNAVQTVEGVLSWSVGENDNRRVIIGTSKENRTYRQGGYDRRPRRNQGRGSRAPRRESYSQVPTREPRKDSTDLPLYGIINK